MRFQDKKIIVTGAHRSMGMEMAKRFAIEGADVAISYRNHSEGAEKLVKEMAEIGKNVKGFYADFAINNGVTHFYNEALSYLGRVDILINNAGVFFPDRLLDLSIENLQLSFQVNSIAPFLLMQLCAKNMIANKIKGNIINISSIAAMTSLPRGLAYAASKAAIQKLTQNAALDLSAHGIRVNAIAPGPIAAGMNEDKPKTHKEQWEKRRTEMPLGRFGTPEDIANMALFLGSDEAQWITGKIFEVDGGALL